MQNIESWLPAFSREETDILASFNSLHLLPAWRFWQSGWTWDRQPALSNQFLGNGPSFGTSCAFALRHERPLVLCAGTGWCKEWTGLTLSDHDSNEVGWRLLIHPYMVFYVQTMYRSVQIVRNACNLLTFIRTWYAHMRANTFTTGWKTHVQTGSYFSGRGMRVGNVTSLGPNFCPFQHR